MSLNRREFIQLLSLAAAAGLPLTGRSSSSDPAQIYDFPSFGNVSLLHFTDCHAQLLPLYFREPSANIGLGDAFGRVPHRVGIRPGASPCRWLFPRLFLNPAGFATGLCLHLSGL